MVRRRCPVCTSKEWHKEPSSGLITCSEGHVLQNYRNETQETTDLGPHRLRKRTLNASQATEHPQSRADAQLYHGARARYFYFECLQLLLRKQVAALISEWTLPPEFEVVCRDLWALHLMLLADPPSAEPYFYAKERAEGREEGHAGERGEEGERSDGEEDGSSSSSSSQDEVLNELLKEASQSEGSSEEDEAVGRKDKSAKMPARRNRYKEPAGNLAVLMIGCWMMRLPVIYKDLIRLIEAYKLPYLDGARTLPAEMRRHLAKGTMAMLSPRFPPSVLGVHRLTSRLARLCCKSYGIQTPEANAGPLLWRAVRAMKGEATLYGLAKTMGRVLSVPLTLYPATEGAGHKWDNVPVELGLVSAVVVVLKLVYGLDGRRRRAEVAEDPAWALPGEEAYIASLTSVETEDASLFSARDHVDMQALDERQLDEYLDFCERVLPDSTSPTIAGSTSTSTSTSTLTSTTLREKRFTSGIEPGTSVRVYRSMDVLGTFPAEYGRVLEVAAQFVGVSAEDVARVVEGFERRLIRGRGNF